MKRNRLVGVVLSSVAFAACGDSDFPTNTCSGVTSAHCIEVQGGDAQGLLEAVNAASPDTTIILGKGRFALDNQVTIRANGIHLVGQGIDTTTLDFGPATAQINGVDVIGDDFLVQDLTVVDSPKDGIRVESSNGVVFRRIRATWTTPEDPTNGSYGIYPVKSRNVLVEDSRAENASDAGLYVGQCMHVIVRNNYVTGNVAGLEIENTEYADVYGNTAENNVGGIVVFDLPGNPIVGRDIRLRDNIIRNNNGANFAPGGTVRMIPSGTGTFAMASRRVEITGNTYEGNNTGDIAILSGFVIESDPTKWAHDTSTLVGDWQDLNLLSGGAGKVTNFRTENIVIANNTHMGSGGAPDNADPLMFGFLLGALYGSTPVSSVLYDSIGESTFDATTPANNSNDNHICVGGNTNGTFASLDLAVQSTTPGSPILRLNTAPFAPFDCTTLNGGPVAAVSLPSAGN